MLVTKVILIVLAALVILYLLMIMPRLSGKSKREPYTRVLYAHRGLHDNDSDAPENSLAAFKKAIDGGFGIECDVQLTKDGVPVIFHDFTLGRVLRYPDGNIPGNAVNNSDGSFGVAGKVIDYTYEELQQFHILNSEEKIPKFEEFLKLVDGRVPLVIELKIECFDLSVCPLVDSMLREYKGVYCIESFNPLGLFWYRRHHNEVFRGQLSDAFHKDKPDEFRGPLYFILTNLLLNFLTKPDFIAFNHRYYKCLSRTLCRNLYKNTAASWTIKSQEELDRARNHFDIYIFDSFVPNNGANNKMY